MRQALDPHACQDRASLSPISQLVIPTQDVPQDDRLHSQTLRAVQASPQFTPPDLLAQPSDVAHRQHCTPGTPNSPPLLMPLPTYLARAMTLLSLLSAAASCSTFTSEVERGGEAGQGGAPQASCEDLSCGENAQCATEGGSANCVCVPGYQETDGTCLDVDECTLGSDDCDGNAECTNLDGSFACNCATGFFGNGLSCRPLLQLVSVSLNGTPGNGSSDGATVSSDGRFVAFASTASDLVRPDTNNVQDVFVRDMEEGKTVRVTVSSDGEQASAWSYGLSISADARYVAFVSHATNLVPNDTNGEPDIFVHDTHTQTTERVSVSSSGQQANGPSFAAQLSPDGRHIAFSTRATNLAPVNGTAPETNQIVYRNLDTGLTEFVSLSPDGVPANSSCSEPFISDGGAFVGFQSSATNLLVDAPTGKKVFLQHRSQPPYVLEHVLGAYAELPVIAASGAFLAFVSPSETILGGSYTGSNVYRYDVTRESVAIVSLTALGTTPDGDSLEKPSISADGLVVAFTSSSSNLVAKDTNGVDDVFVVSPGRFPIRRISVGSLGEQGNEASQAPALSGDGRLVAFSSSSTAFAPSGGHAQVYLRAIDSEDE